MKRQRDLKIKDFSGIPELPDDCIDEAMPKKQKFAVLSLNPGIDRALYLPSPMEAGSLNRAARSVTTQGSKGANVAIMLHRLGCEVEYYAFSGGEFGELCDSFLTREGIKVNSVETVCGVRMNTKVIDSECVCTELNERGGVFSPSETAALTEMFMATDADVLCLCGSIPQGVEKSVYNFVLTRARRKGMITVLDADGDALRLGIEARPDYIKPNRRELAGLCGVDEAAFADEREVLAAARRIYEQYGTNVICTLDEQGSIYVGREGQWRVGVAKFPLRGFSGAGDTYLAAFLHARLAEEKSVPDALRFAARASAAKISLPGSELPTKPYIDTVPDVEVVEL